MKVGFMILLALFLIIIIALLVVVSVALLLKSEGTTTMCCECAYYKSGKCKHWDEKRTPDMGICEAFKTKKK